MNIKKTHVVHQFSPTASKKTKTRLSSSGRTHRLALCITMLKIYLFTHFSSTINLLKSIILNLR